MASKIYSGKVSVIKNTKNVITVQQDDNGAFDSSNVAELYKTMLEFGKKLKCEVRIYKPKPNGTVPLLMADKWGKPYLAVLVASEAPSRVTVTKLA